ncbi:carbamoyl phosphate synthetase II-related [Plasmodium yoelii yoelii]|uniref:carbamoyl-phosphate synthase (ammonia) n=1 Tax=Plasmodium yoelii yoelii TaxID=73239 RepID=Q7RB91_PLAYO|nr:carbamoyl phosphate synthetase II-related [Plasmodium yoelii yoelii]
MNSSMKSVGEVMSIGRTFEESIQKSLRCIDDNYLGFSNTYCIDWNEEKIIDELKNPSPKRIDAIHQAFHLNMSIDVIHELTNIDYWFLYKFYNIYNLENKLKSLTLEQLSFYDLKYYKKHGFSDKQIAHYLSYNVKTKESDVMKYRENIGLHPHIKVIDTLSAEFPALTNYLYLTYQGTEHDVLPLNMKVKKRKDHRLISREYNEIRDGIPHHWHKNNNKVIYDEFSFNQETSQQNGLNCSRADINDAEEANKVTNNDGENGEMQNTEKNPDYTTIPSCKYMNNYGNGRYMGHEQNDMFNLKNFLKNNKREEGFSDNNQQDTIGDDNKKRCPFSGNKMINQNDYHNFGIHQGMKCPMKEKKENCILNNKSYPNNTKNEQKNENGNPNDGNILEEFKSNRSSHSTNDQLYLENCNTSEDDENNANPDKSMRMDDNRGNINNIANNSYYIRDSVYNNEYKINKMRELINNDSKGEVIKSDKNFGNSKCEYINSNKEKAKKINYNEENTMVYSMNEQEENEKSFSNNNKMASKNNNNLMNSYNDDNKSDCFSELSYIQNHKKNINYIENDYGYEDLYSGSDNCYSSYSISMNDENNDSSVLDYEEDELNSELSSINSENDNIFHEKFNDIGFKIIDNKSEMEKEKKKCFIVLGCGCYRIGSSVEFDWSAIHCVKTIRKLNHKAILINCNPETVSTDYDESDRLYFDEITTEVIKFIHNFEKSQGVIIAFGGQTSNNLVFSLYKNNVNILGSSAKSVDCCENRNKFSHLCDSLKIDQPKWNKFTKLSKAMQFANEVKFPVLVRPSYVLSGAAMRVVNSFEELKNFLMKAAIVSKDNPVVISKFIENAKEIEIDCVSKNGKMINYAISEHVENAGVHSGDATLILPAQNIYVETHRKIKKISEKISKYLNISGPFNIQFICHQNEIKIIECNLRASRTFPFISKALNLNFIDLATRILMGYDVKPINISLIDLEYTAIKSPIFSFNRLHGSDCILGVEMKSTGEVACFGLNKYEALLKSLVATGMKLPKKSILISIKNLNNKLAFEEPFQLLFLMGFTIYATEGTYEFYSKFLASFNIDKDSKFHQKLIKVHNKDSENILPNITDLIMNHKVEMVINITDALTTKVTSHGYKIRRLASDFQVPILTNMKLTSLFIDSLYRKFCRKKERRPFYTIKKELYILYSDFTLVILRIHIKLL